MKRPGIIILVIIACYLMCIVIYSIHTMFKNDYAISVLNLTAFIVILIIAYMGGKKIIKRIDSEKIIIVLLFMLPCIVATYNTNYSTDGSVGYYSTNIPVSIYIKPLGIGIWNISYDLLSDFKRYIINFNLYQMKKLELLNLIIIPYSYFLLKKYLFSKLKEEKQ